MSSASKDWLGDWFLKHPETAAVFGHLCVGDSLLGKVYSRRVVCGKGLRALQESVRVKGMFCTSFPTEEPEEPSWLAQADRDRQAIFNKI